MIRHHQYRCDPDTPDDSRQYFDCSHYFLTYRYDRIVAVLYDMIEQWMDWQQNPQDLVHWHKIQFRLVPLKKSINDYEYHTRVDDIASTVLSK